MEEEGRTRRRSSIVRAKELVAGAVAKIAEPRKEIDPEEEPDFTERNPNWEEDLPPIFPSSDESLLLSEDAVPQISVIHAAGPSTAPPKKETKSDIPESGLFSRKRWKSAYFFVKREMLLRKQSMRSSLGTGAEMEGKALGLWDTSSNLRFKLFRFLYNQATESVLLILILFHLIVIILKASKKTTWGENKLTLLQINILDTLMTCIFTVECIARIACLGFYKGPNAYLRNGYNQLDFLAVFDSWIHLAVAGFQNNEGFFRFAIFRVFRGLLSVRRIGFFANVLAVVEAVKRSLTPLEDVLMLMMILLFFYSLIGLQFFSGDLLYRCVRKTDNETSYPPMFCAHRPGRGFVCPKSQNMTCKKVGNPNYGVTNFDMIPFSFLTLFTVISLEGWTQTMYQIANTEYQYADAYFISLVVIVSYFIVNIIVAAISGVFLRVRHEHQILLKRSRKSTGFSFYNATVLASILKDVIISEQNKKTTCIESFRQRSQQVRKRMEKAVSHGSDSFKRVMSSSSFRFSRSSTMLDGNEWQGTRTLSRAFSRSVTRGSKRARETLSSKCELLVKSNLFRYLEILAVTGNLITFASYAQGMSAAVLTTLYTAEVGFLIIFAAFMVIRFLAFGLGGYIDDRMNILDTVTIAISAGSVISRAYPNISVIRILRWFYYDKKLKRKHVSTVADCLKGLGALATVAFFFFLVILIFAVMGMEMYAGEFYRFKDGYPRTNFDNIFNAMLLFFTVTTGESWINQMWNTMRSGVKNSWFAPFMFILYFVITVYLVLNLIIAVILEKTELTDNHKKRIQKAEYMKQLKQKQGRLLSSTRSGTWVVGAVEKTRSRVQGLAKMVTSTKVRSISIRSRGRTIAESGQSRRSEQEGSSTMVEQQHQQQHPVIMTQRASQLLQGAGFPKDLAYIPAAGTALRQSMIALVDQESTSQLKLGAEHAAIIDPNQPSIDQLPPRGSFELSEYDELKRTYSSRRTIPWYLTEKPLFIFSDESRVRQFCVKVCDSRYFKYLTLAVVILSVIVIIAMPHGGNSTLFPANYFIFAVLLAEFMIKVVGFGFLLTPDPYLGDAYNFIDLFLLVIDGLILIPWSQPSTKMAILTLVALRPLRLMCRVENIKRLTTNIIQTLPAIASVMVFTFAIFSIFAVIGVQLFRGRFYACTDDSVIHHGTCTGTYISKTGILASRAWVNPPFHFDNYPSAMLALFVCSTFDNWITQFMYPVMDINGVRGNQPVRNKSPLNALFFVAFISIGGFFIIRMFVGVFIDQFGMISGSKLLTERQKLWRDTNRIIQKMVPIRVPKVPKNRIRAFLHKIVTCRAYPQVARGIVLVNYLWLSTHFANQPPKLTQCRNIVETSFACFYFLEAQVKFWGHEFHDFIADYWNIFEIMNATCQMPFIQPETLGLRKTIGRVFMGLRIFRVIRYTPRLNRLLRVVLASMSHMFDTMGLLAIFLVAFSAMAVQIFGIMRDGMCVGPDMNFKSFGHALVVLFQVTTADNWSCVMADGRVNYPWCTLGDTEYTGDCGKPAVSVLFFVVFSFLSTQICMNLFVAGIIDTITFGLLKESTIITPANLTAYQHLWIQKEFDDDGIGYIGLHKLRFFLNRLGFPLGRRHNAPCKWYARIEWEVLNFHVYGKGVAFRDLLETLTLYKIGSKGLELAVRIEREKTIHGVYRHGASIKLQSCVRGFLERTKQQQKFDRKK